MRVESLCAWLRVVATVAAFSLALNQTWADGSKAKTVSSELTTKTAAVENNGKRIGTSSPSQIMIEEVRVSRTDQQTQVRVEGSGQLLYAPLCLDQPNRLVLDFSGALVHMQQKSIPSNLQPVRAVRVGQFKADVARVVIDLDDLVRYTISANGNAVTVVFEPSALVASCAAAKAEKLPTVDADPGPSPRLSPERTEIDPSKMSPAESLGSTVVTPAGPATVRVEPSESASPGLRPAAAPTARPPAPPPAREQGGKDRGELISAPLHDDYVIGPQDVVAINVWREPELSKAVSVRPDGKISLPLVGEVSASGLTPRMLQMRIAEELEAYLHKPDVTVTVQEANSHRFNIVGEVLRPGSYPLAKPTTVLDAIATAGGFREFAKVKKIYVLRRMPAEANSAVPSDDVKLYFNYKDVIRGKHSAQNVKLESGDTVVVP